MRRFARFSAGCLAAAAAWLPAGCGEGEPAPSGTNPFASSPSSPAPVQPPRPISSEQLPRGTAPPTVHRQRPPGPVTGRSSASQANGTATANGTHDAGNSTKPEPAPPPAMTEQDQAIAAATRMIDDNPRSAHVAYNNRAVAYYKKGEHERALADLNKAIGLKPDYAEAYMNRGVVYEVLGDIGRAEADFAKARQVGR